MEALVSEGSHEFTVVWSPFGKHIVQEAVWKGITYSETISVSGFNSLQIIYYSIVESRLGEITIYNYIKIG